MSASGDGGSDTGGSDDGGSDCGGSDSGQIAGLEAMALGLLVLLAGLVLVGAAWGAVDAKATAAAAAREAARAYVEAPDSATASESADAAAREVVAGYGRDERRLELVRSGDFGRCARITYEALYPLPVLRVPFSDSSIGGWIVRARHSEVVDPFRSGLAGKADCGR